jgi:hypothetical protein
MAKKISALTEAVTNYNVMLMKHRNALKEMLQHDCFKDVKSEFDSKEEVALYEGLNEGVLGPNPSSEPSGLKKINLPFPGPGQYGDATKPLGKLRAALKSAEMDSFQSVNDLSEKMETVVSAVDDVLPLLDAEEPVVRKEAKVLVAKLYFTISNMFKVVTEKAKELRLKLPRDFDAEEARSLMKNANMASTIAGSEADASIPKTREPGFFRGIMDKLRGR